MAAPAQSGGPQRSGSQSRHRVRLAYLVSHPIQYQAPLLRRIAQEEDIDLTVFFGSDFSLRSYADKGFGVSVEWDTPLLEGYRHEFLPVLLDNATVSVTRPLNYGIFSRLRGCNGAPRFDALWLHGYSSLNALQALLAAKALGIPVLLRADPWLGDRPRSQTKLLAKKLLFHGLKRFLAGVLPIGTLNRAYWRHYLGENFPLWTMPYAVDNEYFQCRSQKACSGRAELLAELNLDGTRPVILFASKLQTRKRCIDLLEAYLALVPGGDPHPYLVIVGDGEQRPALERRAAASGCPSIRFCGFRNQSELPRFFDIATVFVLPSRHEPWGLIVNEVMNAGKPIILSDDVGCHPDLLTNGVEGYLFPTGNVAALTQCLRKLLDTPGAAERMGQRARARMAAWNFEEDVRGLRQALAATTHKILP
jgi:glycosyltransferase involved in cell wall biosynthesis